MAVSTALVIDDSKSARIMLSRLVQSNGLEVNMVESGEEAIQYLQTHALPDVIFMDHMMPGMDGLETTRQITADPRTRNIPILMYTSKEGPEYEEEVFASGAYAMLGKPAKPERLKELIEELNNRVLPETDSEADAVIEIEAATEIDHAVPETVSAAQVAEEPEITLEEQPIATSTEEEDEEMSKELIEEVSAKLIARALEDALQPLNATLQRLETFTQENKSEIRKLSARQDANVNLVSQPVLDASLRQTTTQLQTQITSEIKSIRDLLEQKAELSPKALEQIKQIATQSGAEAGADRAEKAAISTSEAVAAKIGAAQAQIQVQQDIAPYIQQTKNARLMAMIAIVVAAAAIIHSFLP
jgi:CheY-like chemotaxis protein